MKANKVSDRLDDGSDEEEQILWVQWVQKGWVSFVNLTYGLETGEEFGKF